MVNLKSIVRKYDLEDVNIIDDCYYQACRQIKKLGYNDFSEELLIKIIQDKLETIGITDYKDIDNISNYYISLRKEELMSEIVAKIENSNEEPITVVEKELDIENKDKMEDTMLTSNNTGIDQTIGRNKKTGYKTEIKNLY